MDLGSAEGKCKPTSNVNLRMEKNRSSTGTAQSIPVIDYEGSGYQTDFWEGQGRDYEDKSERIALRRLMPPTGLRIAEIGAGFGRLADLYQGYDQVVLFDYSRSLLRDASERLGHDSRFVFVAGNIYDLPLASGLFDTLVMVRVMHHLADVSGALRHLHRVVHGYGVLVLEYANKRNLKSIMRWATGKQSWSPMDLQPIEFVELNFDFHPKWMESRFRESGLGVKNRYAVSHFRLPLLKKRIPADRLAMIDSWFFNSAGCFPLAPSVFVKAISTESRPRSTVAVAPDAVHQLFRCPICGVESLTSLEPDLVQCPDCSARFASSSGVWDFKEPV